GQFDVGMDGITITAERKEQVDFSIPYKTLQNYMLVRADESRFTTPAEFAADENLLIGSQAGTTQFYTAVYDVLDGNGLCRKRTRLHRGQSGQTQAGRRPAGQRGYRLYLYAGQRPHRPI
ncbi:MAG TPA: transporter substrate-binding domain-containing protein, partial [Caldilineaceae bacterium]|nr:transporter substrate-binding domain-containing protein [Caldilineaceae bacterium]